MFLRLERDQHEIQCQYRSVECACLPGICMIECVFGILEPSLFALPLFAVLPFSLPGIAFYPQNSSIQSCVRILCYLEYGFHKFMEKWYLCLLIYTVAVYGCEQELSITV